MRPIILALATKISLECGTYTGVTYRDPEYKILEPVVTDELAEVAMGLKVRADMSAADVAKKVHKPVPYVEKALDELGQIGFCRYFERNGIRYYNLPIWVPGIMEMMVGNKELCEKYPVIAECFEEYTRRRIAPLAPFVPIGQGMMRVVPVEAAIANDTRRGSYEEISRMVENAYSIAVTDCSCRRTRRLMGEGCGHLETDVCIFLNEGAEYHIRSGHGREIDKAECYEILKRCEENGLVHEFSNLDPQKGAAAICNCCGCSCFSLRIAQYFKTPDVVRSNYVAQVDKEKCVACGQCVENCNLGALKLGQKLCSEPDEAPEHTTPHDKLLWTSKEYNVDYRLNRGYVTDDGTAPCKTKCPAHIPVQGYLKLAAQGRFDEALELIRGENPFPAVCGRVCPKFCEEECTRGKVDAPVAIDDVKKFLAQRELDPKTRIIPKMLNMTGKPFEEKIAVIGGGPAGLSCAYYLAHWGYPVTVFEKQKTLGGMMTMGIPEFRLDRDVVNAEIDILREMGVEFKTGVEVGKNVTLKELRAEGYKAFFVAIGAWKSSPIGCKGESLKGVFAGIDFLRRVNTGAKKPELGKSVAVVGGGNVAIDVARTAVRLGAEKVTVLYRRTRDEMPAADEEVAEAEAEGVKFKFLVAPEEILGKDGKAVSVKLQVMELGEADASGRRKPVPVEGQFETIKVDSVIAAIGQSVEWGKLIENSYVKTGKGGAAVADPVTFQTGEFDVFVGGDVMTGPKFVIDAIAAGKEGAISINRYVHEGQSLTIGRRVKDYAMLDKSEVNLSGFDRAPRQKSKDGPVKEAKGTFKDLRGTLTEKQILKETERCLGCGATVVDPAVCVGCGVCTTKCKFDAISLVRVSDNRGDKYEKLMLESGKNLAKRAKDLTVKKIAVTRAALGK